MKVSAYCAGFIFLATISMTSCSLTQELRARALGVPFDGTPGPLDAITDVAGVEVGNTTLISGDGPLVVGVGPVRTGVSVLFPRGKANPDPVYASWFAQNGNGEMTGTTWVQESGFLEGPIAITNTHSVGVVHDAVIAWGLKHGAAQQPWSLPVVAETFDGYLSRALTSILVSIMPISKRSLSLTLILLLTLSVVRQVRASAYDAKPKLVVLLIIDQFREDYLERYKAGLKGRGFRLFLDKGAYFPDCYYNYANTKTAPGHSTLGTGAYSDGHGISSNEWWDLARSKQHQVSAVEDERYQIVGLATASGTDVGASPRNLRASTIGDELRLATKGQSLVYGISLKDRAAILPAGAAANGAFWIDHDTGTFVTSSFYMNELPKWAVAFNGSDRAELALQEAGISKAGAFYDQVGKTPASSAYELDFARALITNEQLGRHATTDLVTISLSAPDLAGHAAGPDSPEEHAMVEAIDTQLDSFFTWLDKNIDGGLANIWVTLSADHGIAPVAAQAATLGMPATQIDVKKLVANLNDAMDAKFSPGEKVVYILPDQEFPYFSLNTPSFQVAGINEQEAEQAVAAAVEPAFQALNPASTETVTPMPYVADPVAETAPAPTAKKKPTAAKSKTKAAIVAEAPEEPAPPTPPPTRYAPKPFPMHVYTRLDLLNGQYPASEFGTLLAHSYSPNGGWYVMIIPQAFQMEAYGGGTGTTHFSPYSYDRHVPLAFFGAPFTAGTYHGRVEPVDLAATLASMLNINQPSASIGHILTQAIRPIPVPPPARTPHHTRAETKTEADAPSK